MTATIDAALARIDRQLAHERRLLARKTAEGRTREAADHQARIDRLEAWRLVLPAISGGGGGADGADAVTRFHLDLCSGVGGFALAAQWAGYTTIGFCEIDPWCRRVLAKNFPGVPQHDDLWTLTSATVRGWIGERAEANSILAHAERIGRTSREVHTGNVIPALSGTAAGASGTGSARRTDAPRLDLITGGYPCQPFSLAGKRLGAPDDRHLWPAIAALAADLKPRRMLLENVYGHVSMGLDAVLSDLEALGYACGAVVIPAAAVGAPHRRDRVWILADADGGRAGERGERAHPAGQGAEWGDERGRGGSHPEQIAIRRTGKDSRHVADAAARGVRRGEPSREPGLAARGGEATDAGWPVYDANGGRHRRPIEQLCTGRDGALSSGGREVVGGVGDAPHGLPERLARSGWRVGPDVADPWAGDWEAGCPRTTTHEPDRVNKLKALGNAIVPSVAYTILKCWDESEAING